MNFHFLRVTIKYIKSNKCPLRKQLILKIEDRMVFLSVRDNLRKLRYPFMFLVQRDTLTPWKYLYYTYQLINYF